MCYSSYNNLTSAVLFSGLWTEEIKPRGMPHKTIRNENTAAQIFQFYVHILVTWITVWRSLSRSRHIILPVQTEVLLWCGVWAHCAFFRWRRCKPLMGTRDCTDRQTDTVSGNVTSSATWQCHFALIKVKPSLPTARRHMPESRYNSVHSYPRP